MDKTKTVAIFCLVIICMLGAVLYALRGNLCKKQEKAEVTDENPNG